MNKRQYIQLNGYEGLAVAIIDRAVQDARQGDSTARQWLKESQLVQTTLDYYNMPHALIAARLGQGMGQQWQRITQN
jgi:hypothetical protein